MPERPPPTPIRVVIVEDHPLMREGTQALLDRQDGIAVVGATGEGKAAFRLVAERRPDVLLLDIHLPDLSGVEVARRVRASFPAVAVLVLTGYDDVSYARTLLDVGVLGYLSKTVSSMEIIAAVHAVAAGRTMLVSEAAKIALGAGGGPLTAREHEVLDLLVTGRRNAEIATALSMSIKTVEYHLGHLFQKLDARSRTEAILRARQRGLVRTDRSVRTDNA